MAHEPLTEEESTSVKNSPLHEAADGAPGASLSELFSRDPLKLSDQDLDTIVDHLRKSRLQWENEDSPGKKKSRKAKAAAAAPKPKADPNLSLGDLGL